MVNLRVQVEEFDDVQKRTHFRRHVQVKDQTDLMDVTFWNKYATRTFQKGETLLLTGAEANSRSISSTEKTRQINVWYSAMVLECIGEYEEYALNK